MITSNRPQTMKKCELARRTPSETPSPPLSSVLLGRSRAPSSCPMCLRSVKLISVFQKRQFPRICEVLVVSPGQPRARPGGVRKRPGLRGAAGGDPTSRGAAGGSRVSRRADGRGVDTMPGDGWPGRQGIVCCVLAIDAPPAGHGGS